MRAFAAVALSLLAGGCKVAPPDPFVAANRALKRDDLLQALLAYDAVPIAHARYPEARAAAGEVELRMRRCQELILEALRLRSEWRDEDALTVLRRAREHWPKQPLLEHWIEATERRLTLFGRRETLPQPAAAEPPAVPLLEASAAPRPHVEVDAHTDGHGSAPTAVDAPDEQMIEPVAPVVAAPPDNLPSVAPPNGAAGSTEPNVVARPARGEDPVAPRLVAVEALLRAGDLEAAVAELVELASRNGDDARVRVRLARLLHQRALLRYGEGALAAAIADWQRVLEFEPDNAAVRSCLSRALVEHRSPEAKQAHDGF